MIENLVALLMKNYHLWVVFISFRISCQLFRFEVIWNFTSIL